MIAHLENIHPLVSTEIPLDAEMLATMGLNEKLCERLTVNHFTPSHSPRVKANKLYFMSKDGVQKLTRLLSILLEQPWGEQVLHLKLLESKILDVLCCFSHGGEDYQEQLIKHDVLGYTLAMLLRVKLVPQQKVEDVQGSLGVQHYNDYLVLDMVGSVLEMMNM